MDIGQDSHSRATTVASQDVDLEDTLQQFGPRVIPGANGSGSHTAATLTSVRSLGVTGHDLRAPTCRGGQNPVVPNEVEPGRGHQGREFLQQLQGLEDDMCRPVAPAVPELIHDSAVRQGREALGSDCRASDVSAQ
jgi:hypothetical protein